MDKSPYIQRSSEITKIGRLEIHMDQLEHKGVVRPYSYASVPEGVHVLPIVGDKVCVLRQYRYSINQWTDQTGAHNACQVSRFQYQLDELLSKYEHAWPKKEDTAQVFNPSSAIGGEDVMLYPIALMCGCLAEDTMILMGDGVWKRICDIRIGERIMQPDDGLPILVQNVWRGREKELIMIRTLDGGFVEMTEEHPVRQESGFIRAGELKPGDTVYGEEGRTMTVVSVRKEPYNGSVYNLDLQRDGRNVGNGYFLANGIVVGDNRMQNGL